MGENYSYWQANGVEWIGTAIWCSHSSAYDIMEDQLKFREVCPRLLPRDVINDRFLCWYCCIDKSMGKVHQCWRKLCGEIKEQCKPKIRQFTFSYSIFFLLAFCEWHWISFVVYNYETPLATLLVYSFALNVGRLWLPFPNHVEMEYLYEDATLWTVPGKM